MAFEVTDALWEMPGFLVAVNRPNSVHRLLLCNYIAQSFHGNCSGKVYNRDNLTSRTRFFPYFVTNVGGKTFYTFYQ